MGLPRHFQQRIPHIIQNHQFIDERNHFIPITWFRVSQLADSFSATVFKSHRINVLGRKFYSLPAFTKTRASPKRTPGSVLRNQCIESGNERQALCGSFQRISHECGRSILFAKPQNDSIYFLKGFHR
jgi:hypothetical protein